MLLTAWLPSPHFSEPTLFRSATPTPGLGTLTDSLVLTNGREERAEGPFRQGELSLSAMFHHSTISEKPGLLWEFWPQLSLGSTTEAGPGRQDTVYKQLGIERPPAPQLHPLLPSLLPCWGSPGSTAALTPRSGGRTSRPPGSCAGADGVESGGWNHPLQRPSRSGFPSCSAECMIWTSYCTCRSIFHVGVRCLVLG